jgi:hypothetical protein
VSSVLQERLDPRHVLTLVFLAVLVVASYVLVVHYYNAEGGVRVQGGLPEQMNAPLLVTVEPLSIDAVKDTATIRLTFDSPDGSLLDANGRLAQGLRASIASSDGAQEVLFPAGSAIGRAEVEIGTNGEIAAYPFDVHEGFTGIVMDTFEKGPGGVENSTGAIPLGARALGGINGWDTNVSLPGSVSDSVLITWNFDRAFSNELFSLLLLALGTVLSILALIVAIRVFTRRQHFDVPLLAWTATLLFALPVLRTYMPGAPPLGAAIDIYVYFWVIVIAVIAASLTAVSVITHRKVSPTPETSHAP